MQFPFHHHVSISHRGHPALLTRAGSALGYTAGAWLFLMVTNSTQAQEAEPAPFVEPLVAAAEISSAPAKQFLDPSLSVDSSTASISESAPAVAEPAPDQPQSLDASGDFAAGIASAQDSAADAAPGDPAPSDAAPSDAAPLEVGDQTMLSDREPKKFSIRLQGSAVYNDNIRLGNGSGNGQVSDLILSAGGGFTWQPFTSKNRKFSFDYDGTANFYTDHSEYDGTDHIVATSGFLSRGGTTLTLNGSYSQLSGVELESRQFQDREVASFGASLEQELTGKLSLSASLDYHTSLYDVLLSSEGMAGRLGLNWALSAKANIGIAAAGGYTDSDSTGKQTYESLLLTTGYRVTEKLQLDANAGVQRGETIGDQAGDDGSHFVFGLGANYQVGEKTDVSLRLSTGSVTTAVQDGGASAGDSLNFNFAASHRFSDRLSARLFASKTTPSSTTVANASIERTAFGAGVARKLGQNLTWSFDGGYELSDYVSTTGADTISREENSWTLRSSLMWRPVEATTVTLFYDLREVTSNTESLEYDQNRIGVSIGRIW